MNNQTALSIFDSALQVIAEAEAVTKRANLLTWRLTAFNTFEALLNAKGGYRPSLSRRDPDTRILGALYDAAQQARGDDRRAFMYGSPHKKGSIIDRANYVNADNWYRVGMRVAWWDRYTRQWIVYTINEQGHQVGSADFYPNSKALLMGEECHA